MGNTVNEPNLAVSNTIVSPKKAAELLLGNENNRGLSKSTVARFAKAMVDGEWMANGETIKISKRGRLIDGQHRLNAIIVSGVPTKLLVVKNLDEKIFATIDVGKKRDGADALAIAGYEKNHKMAASSIKKVKNLYEGRNTYQLSTGTARIENYELVQQFMNVPRLEERLNRAVHFSSCIKLLSPSILGSLYYIFAEKDYDDAEAFFAGLNKGSNLSDGSPILALRNRMIDIRASDEPTSLGRKMSYTIEAWNAYRKKNTEFKFHKHSGEAFTIDQIL